MTTDKESYDGRVIHLDDDFDQLEGRVVEKVTSRDGTRIAFERIGSGPPVVVVGAGLNDRVMFTPLATSMASEFTVVNYDRRGRGDSDLGDLDTWSIEAEIDDLKAVLGAVGEPAHVFGNCTGGVISVLAAARGVPMRKLAVYEPPYWSWRTSENDLDHLRELVDQDDRTEIVTVFARDIASFVKPENIEAFKSHPAWAAFESMAPSAYYDALIGCRHLEIPYEEVRRITVPTLVMSGTIGVKEIHEACARLVEEIPTAELLVREGFDHLFDQVAWAPNLMEFFAG
ncbi:alpha/beta fold hydrolase [Kineosporia succinea]|uniref:Pimeloyl-ACP methyl ester carboxylesterase n=1 Tax=Kineosporia succinea TaxID=84632 RepID=A0ABT9PCH6_9ACTN|nr:alpha/beta hydrolase [Kineosporia succinea]MDP9829670.1 pimeloyl-ACP methyl ester carboxylesterase [Kineosporia succinea]